MAGQIPQHLLAPGLAPPRQLGQGRAVPGLYRVLGGMCAWCHGGGPSDPQACCWRARPTWMLYLLLLSGMLVRAMLHQSLTDMSRRLETCYYQHCTSFTDPGERAGSKAVKWGRQGITWECHPECKRAVRGDILTQSTPRCVSSHHRVSLSRAMAAFQRSSQGILKNTPALLFLISKSTVFTRWTVTSLSTSNKL